MFEAFKIQINFGLKVSENWISIRCVCVWEVEDRAIWYRALQLEWYMSIIVWWFDIWMHAFSLILDSEVYKWLKVGFKWSNVQTHRMAGSSSSASCVFEIQLHVGFEYQGCCSWMIKRRVLIDIRLKYL
jgi:hypothetical protein